MLKTSVRGLADWKNRGENILMEKMKFLLKVCVAKSLTDTAIVLQTQTRALMKLEKFHLQTDFSNNKDNYKTELYSIYL